MAGLTAEKERTETDGSQQMHRNHQTGKHDGNHAGVDISTAARL